MLEEECIGGSEENNMVATLELARDGYIHAREVSGSYWKTVSGGLLSGAGRLIGKEVLTPDEKLALARGEYERLRSDHITSSLEDQEPGLDLGEQMAEMLIAEAEILSNREQELSQNTPKLDQLARLYGNPKVRTALSLGINIGIAGSFALGILPLTVVLIGARVAMGTARMEGSMKKTQDKISETIGVKSDLFMDTLGVRAKDTGKSELDLLTERVASDGQGNDLYKELLIKALQEGRDLSEVDNLNAMRDEALIFARRTGATRWAASAALVAGFSLIGGGLIQDILQAPIAEAADLSQVATDTFSYNSIDPLYVNDPYLQGNASSLIGTAHNIYAERVFGTGLPPVDLETGSHAVDHYNYWTWFYKNYYANMAEVNEIARGITEETMKQVEDPMALFAYGDRGNFDIVWHFIHSSSRHTLTGNVGEFIRYYLPKIGRSLNPKEVDLSGCLSSIRTSMHCNTES